MDELSQDARRLIERALSREEALGVSRREELWSGIGERLVDPGVVLQGASGGVGATHTLGLVLKAAALGSTVAALAWASSALFGPTDSASPSAPRPAPLTTQVGTQAHGAEVPETKTSEPLAAPAPTPSSAKATKEAGSLATNAPPRVPTRARPRADRVVKKSASPAVSAGVPTSAPPSEPVVLEDARPPGGSAQETLRAELALLNQSYALLDAGKPTEALAVLGEHRRKHPNAALAEEAAAARAIAECRLASSREGREARAAGFLARAKSSPLAERVRRACGVPLRK